MVPASENYEYNDYYNVDIVDTKQLDSLQPNQLKLKSVEIILPKNNFLPDRFASQIYNTRQASPHFDAYEH